MSCERQGHVGGEDHHIQPKFRCLYCGAWGYASRWDDSDKESYEECPREDDHSYEEHMEDVDVCS